MHKQLPAPTLRNLRKMTPRWPMTYHQALRAAERQASRLARAWNADEQIIREVHILSLTRMTIVREAPNDHERCRSSGASRYANGHWEVWLNPDEPLVRQRFTLAHEVKHIIDSGCAVDKIYARLTAAEIERVCDQFAACLLMSKQAIFRLWGDGVRTPETLAMACHVSVSAMKRRMTDLGLPIDLDEPTPLTYSTVFPDGPHPDTLPGHLMPDMPTMPSGVTT